MATWKPRSDEPVGSNEHVGRRMFDEPMLAGAQDQPAFQGLLLRHFEERRDREFSLDRLGRTGIDKGVVRYLRPRADADGQNRTPLRAFNGWAVLRAKVLADPPLGNHQMLVIASPITGDDLAENVYHAHVLLPDAETWYQNALHLRHLFTSQGTVERVRSTAGPGRVATLLVNFMNWLPEKLRNRLPETLRSWLLSKGKPLEKKHRR
jgi:hypothetical protein